MGRSVGRKFNTEGPIRADRHYHIPPLTRIDLDDVLGLIRDEKYFVLYAPRQTGKTSVLLALRDLLNSGQAGEFRCVYANVEAGQAMRENIAEGIRTVLRRTGISGERDARRRDAGAALARPAGARRPWAGAVPGAGALEHGGPASAGAADRRDRRAGRRHAAARCFGSFVPATTSVRPRSRTASCCAACATCATTVSTRRPRTA